MPTIKKSPWKMRGFTLVEMLLVITIMTMMAYLAVNALELSTKKDRYKKTAVQFQQIFKAATTYLVNSRQGSGVWPTSVQQLINNKLLQPTNLTQGFMNPWGKTYYIAQNKCTGLLYVYTKVGWYQRDWPAAYHVKALLPNAVVSMIPPIMPITCPLPVGSINTNPVPVPQPQPAGLILKGRYIISTLTIPAGAINRGRAISDMKLLSNNDCFKIQKCFGSETRTIRAVPVAVSGTVGTNNKTGTAYNIYPLQSFQTYVILPTATAQPEKCANAAGITLTPSANSVTCTKKTARVCLDVSTTYGRSKAINSQFPGKILAMSYCKMEEN
jgi:prepilin-type N-terminal cleavage/methylation domain-containing protein